MAKDDHRSVARTPPLALQGHEAPVTVRGAHLTIPDVVRVARQGARVRLTTDADVLHRVAAAYDYVTHAVATGQLLYGVTTGFGGMATGRMAPEDVVELQQNLV
jgi:phenylalanine ammonia-lyase